MKNFIYRFILVSAVILLSSCGGSKPVLYIYNWSDYVKEDLITRFEKENNCKVIMDFFDSNESMFAKLKAGASGYDIVFPTAYMVQVMSHDGMLSEIDHSKIPNIVNIDEKYLPFALDSGMKYSVPYMLSNTGLGYLSDRVDDSFIPSWGIFGDARYAGRMTMLNDMRESIGAALKYLGYSMNSTNPDELEKAGDLLISWKKNLAKFEADQYKNGLVSEEFIITHGYSGDIFQVMEENDKIAYEIPIEGTTVSCDSMVLLKDSKNIDLAYAFINYMLEPEVAAENIEYVYYIAPNKPAYELVSEEIKNEPAVFLSNEMLMKSEVLLDLGEDNLLYSKIWDKVKAVK
ncbi:MAG: spermidine/putrescine ABC transporter substrate-binding protein [Spirochaetia bacterium]|jgi:spermidine/putrescine transport system substrate-binding protein|nr:spermidine/putrescine ABC transporter substrate-binding protein [Spirochaetia bacterium]